MAYLSVSEWLLVNTVSVLERDAVYQLNCIINRRFCQVLDFDLQALYLVHINIYQEVSSQGLIKIGYVRKILFTDFSRFLYAETWKSLWVGLIHLKNFPSSCAPNFAKFLILTCTPRISGADTSITETTVMGYSEHGGGVQDFPLYHVNLIRIQSYSSIHWQTMYYVIIFSFVSWPINIKRCRVPQRPWWSLIYDQNGHWPDQRL